MQHLLRTLVIFIKFYQYWKYYNELPRMQMIIPTLTNELFFISSGNCFVINNQQMNNEESNKILEAYQQSQNMKPLFSQYSYLESLPLTYEDSLSPVPNYPSCAIGMLNAEGEWGSKKGIAFVVEDNYLLTCASNCYSDQHGQYPHIIFTINSNRKTGQDTHKISKVFIPQQYKILKDNERKEHNFALLILQGEVNMKERYGCIRIELNKYQAIQSTSVDCLVNRYGHLQLSKHNLLKQDSMILSGSPLINGKRAFGLVIYEGSNSKQDLLLFSSNIFDQLAEWVQVPNNSFYLSQYQYQEQDFSYLKDVQKRSIQCVFMEKCNFRKICCQFFNELPFSQISQLFLLECKEFGIEQGMQLSFLELDKFRDLKYLQISRANIEADGCQIIASLGFNNLRYLCQSFNPIGDEGCMHLSKAEWPFLRILQLSQCNISKEGVTYLLSGQRRNLQKLDLRQNKISKMFEEANLPRICQILMDNNCISGLDLIFLRFPSWKNITKLFLNKNPIGNKGCKMIKQAGLTLQQLQLGKCGIDSVGIKWLCKANLSHVSRCCLHGNQLGAEGCLALSKAKMSSLSLMTIYNIGTKGKKSLLRAEWAKRAAASQYVVMWQYKSGFRRQINSLGDVGLY